MGKRVLDSIEGITLIAKTLASTKRAPATRELERKLSSEVDRHQRLAQIFAEELLTTKKPVQVVSMDSFLLKPAESRLQSRELYCTVGGDGTFLQTAQVIKGEGNFALGINPDTSSSLGALTGCKVEPSQEPRLVAQQLAQALLSGNMDTSARRRVLVRNVDRPDIKFPLALNEALLCEKKYNRCLKYQFKHEGRDTWRSIRSSGFLASTLTGSTGLLKSLLRSRQDQLNLLIKLDLLRPEVKVTEDLLTRLSDASLSWDQSSTALRFVHRNLVHPDPLEEEEGWAQIPRIKNKTYHSILCVDTNEFEIDYDHELEFQLTKSAEDYLHTLHMRV